MSKFFFISNFIIFDFNLHCCQQTTTEPSVLCPSNLVQPGLWNHLWWIYFTSSVSRKLCSLISWLNFISAEYLYNRAASWYEILPIQFCHKICFYLILRNRIHPMTTPSTWFVDCQYSTGNMFCKFFEFAHIHDFLKIYCENRISEMHKFFSSRSQELRTTGDDVWMNGVLMSSCVTLCRRVSRYVDVCHVMSTCVTLCRRVSRYVDVCHVMSTCVTLCRRVSRYVDVCHVMSTCVTLCRRVSRYVDVCHVMSTCVTLSRRVSRFLIFCFQATEYFADLTEAAHSRIVCFQQSMCQSSQMLKRFFWIRWKSSSYYLCPCFQASVGSTASICIEHVYNVLHTRVYNVLHTRVYNVLYTRRVHPSGRNNTCLHLSIFHVFHFRVINKRPTYLLTSV